MLFYRRWHDRHNIPLHYKTTCDNMMFKTARQAASFHHVSTTNTHTYRSLWERAALPGGAGHLPPTMPTAFTGRCPQKCRGRAPRSSATAASGPPNPESRGLQGSAWKLGRPDCPQRRPSPTTDRCAVSGILSKSYARSRSYPLLV